jgi:hypothetical protein
MMGMMRMYLASLLVTGCGFSLSPAGGVGGDAGDAPALDAPLTEIDAAIDAPIDAPTPLDIAHVAAGDEAALTSMIDYPLSGTVTINTTTGTVIPAVPAGVIVSMIPQEGGGLSLLVIQAQRIEVLAGANVRITGMRGVVFVAKQDLIVHGTLDASAQRTTPGPGGYSSSNGPGAGPDATGASGNETGGAGASFGTRGGNGGNCTAIPQNGPASAGIQGSSTLISLEGGSGGGNALASAVGPCGNGGAGGGAIQLSAPTVEIAGRVAANGGGGDGGRKCSNSQYIDASSGSGGGTGGSIYIQAQSLTGTGWLVANGGGGGGGGCVSCNPGTGAPGQDGHDDATAAPGGTSPQTPNSFGGAGATAAGGQSGFSGSNAGGGGGGAGRIFLAIPDTTSVALSASPPAER